MSSRLVAAKTRVAPLAATSIPRLELMAAILGLRLTESVSRVYSGGLGQAVFWSDSMNVLWWIRGRSRIFKPFVANRVGEIQSLTNPKQWHFVRTNENPADFTTRGMRISDLAKENKWWSGPDFLQKEESDWPVNQIDTNRISAATEIKKTAQASSQAGRINGDWTVISVHEDDQLWRLDPKRYSSWTKLIRIQAWVRRFIDNCRSPNREKGELKAEEIEDVAIQVIKGAKRAVYAILGNADITDEELMTAFTGAEALLNSRPLTYQSANPEDDVPLTPNHFLFGQVGGQFAPESVDETTFNPRKRWRRVQELVRHFWHRWIREWLPALNARKKWLTVERDIEVDDVVLVISPKTPRGHWPLGRIVEVYPGKDGHVRVAKVQVGKEELLRPITKLCQLELS